MRKPKFNCYDSNDKVMYFNVGITPWYVITYDWEKLGNKLITPEVTGHLGIDFDGLYLLQYTGIEDKSGKEIYEGDVIDCLHDGFRFLSKVFFDQGSFVVQQDEDYEPCLYEIHYVEIIGNIYENPELLEEK